jgi:hypothetical protein
MKLQSSDLKLNPQKVRCLFTLLVSACPLNSAVLFKPKQRFTKIKSLIVALLIFLGVVPAHTQSLTLYVDTETKQVYTEPGEDRVKIGDFRRVEEEAGIEDKASELSWESIEQRWEALRVHGRVENRWASRELIPFEKRRWAAEETRERTKPAQRNLAATERALEEGLEAREEALEEQLRALERELEAALERKEAELERELTRAERSRDAVMRSKVPGIIRPEDLERRWYDRIHIRGYTQFRYNETLSGNKDLVAHWQDRSVGPDSSFFIRRARLVIFGDISEHLYVFFQPDFSNTPTGSSTTHFGQLRDAYGDIFFDKKREFRVRVGQSRVPYSFENLQSSQLRLALDRNDALLSCCPDQRDLGVFFYWTPIHVRERFKDVLERNLKGSGDYGMFALGIYNGQGTNRFEQNDDFHVVSRFTYPYQFTNGQILEAGVQAISGRFVPSAEEIDGIVPSLNAPERGFQDQRLGVHAVLYPQPLGLQAEWNWGRGPELNEERMAIETASLNGGYVQATYKLENRWGTWFPFVKWQYFDGALKFMRNAPRNQVSEVEIGLEWEPVPDIELVAAYAMMDRTQVQNPPFPQFQADILRFQLQWNFF